MSMSATGGPPACWHPPVVYDGMSQLDSDSGLHYLPAPTAQEKMF